MSEEQDSLSVLHRAEHALAGLTELERFLEELDARLAEAAARRRKAEDK